MSDEKLPPDPMGDDTRAAVVRQLTDWWSASPHPEIAKLSPAAIRQMAMEAGAFARGIMGEIAELKQLAGSEPEPQARKDEIAAKLAEAFIGPENIFERETGAQVEAKIRLCRMVKEALTSYEEERTPSGEGWQQRITAMEPYFNSKVGAKFCFFCGNPQGASHTSACLWQNAKDATPPASGGEGASK